jgi:deferrochelatase/peroxidase EfeB
MNGDAMNGGKTDSGKMSGGKMDRSHMQKPDQSPTATRRGFLAATAGLLAAAGARGVTTEPTTSTGQVNTPIPSGAAASEPFFGEHQAGIITPIQSHTYFAAFNLTAARREDVIDLFKKWTAAAARMTAGQTAEPLARDPDAPDVDSAETMEMGASRLTITFGLGAGLFMKNGQDRYGLSKGRPEALVDLPRFSGDQLIEGLTGGDLSIQACANDPQVAFHAVRQLARIADGVAELHWAQTGFAANFAAGQTPRNLMGFKDGTNNPPTDDSAAMNQFVWAGHEGPAWMGGGSYLVIRRSRMALEHWDRMKLIFQEQTVGRHKYSGAPLGGKKEFDPINLDAADADGNSIIPDNAHVRLAAAQTNDGARILRRPYSYNDGANFIAERWPPWKQAMEYDAGLLFVSYQRDPRTGFIKIFDQMSKLDQMNQFVTHTGGGLFACPRGIAKGEYLAQGLLAPA